MNTADTLVPRLLACGVSPTDIRGCTGKDLARVEAAAGRPLLASYVRFLSLVGRGAGEFLSDLTAFYPTRNRSPARREHAGHSHHVRDPPPGVGASAIPTT